MSAPAIGQRPRTVPTSATLNTSHPLATGMIGCLIPALGRELVSGNALTTSLTGAGRASTAWGAGGEQTANGDPAYVATLGAYPATMTFVIVAHKRSGSSSRCCLAMINSNGTTEATGGFLVGYSGGSGSGFDTASGTDGAALTYLQHGVAWRFPLGGTVADGPVVICGTRGVGGTSIQSYINMGKSGTATMSATPSGTLTAAIGSSNGATRAAGAGRCGAAALMIYNRVLSESEIASLTFDPFQMLKY